MADSWLRLLQEEEEALENHGDDASCSYRQQVPPRDYTGSMSLASAGISAADGCYTHVLRPASRHALAHVASSDSLLCRSDGHLPSSEGGRRRSDCSDVDMSDCRRMMPSTSLLSLSDLLPRDRDTLSRNNSRENLVVHETLSRNVSSSSLSGMIRNLSNSSLNGMIRNYSSVSLAAVMEQSEVIEQRDEFANSSHTGFTPSHTAAHNDQQAGDDFEYSPASDGGGGGDGRLQHGIHHSYYHAQQPQPQASQSTGKRMHRTRSHNKLVHDVMSGVGRGLPRPASFEKLSRQCADNDSTAPPHPHTHTHTHTY